MASIEVALFETPRKATDKALSHQRYENGSEKLDFSNIGALADNVDEDSPYSDCSSCTPSRNIFLEAPSADSCSSYASSSQTDYRWSDTKSSAIKKVIFLVSFKRALEVYLCF